MDRHSARPTLAIAATLSCLVALSGCGTTPSDRALSGGLLGAGTGAVIGAMTGSAAAGAVFGGLGGAALGALTTPDKINLGEPAWRHSSRRHSRHRAARYAEHCTTRETGSKRITTCDKPD